MIPLSSKWIGNGQIFGMKIAFYQDISTDEYWGYWNTTFRGETKVISHKWPHYPECLLVS
jgi:hypothetical protein